MAAHVVLLFLLIWNAGGNGMSVAARLEAEEPDSRVISSERQQVLPQPESGDNVSASFTDSRSPPQRANEDIRTPSNAAFTRDDRKPNNFDFKVDTASQKDMFKYPDSAAKFLISKHSPELALNHKKRSNLTNGEVEGVINAQSLVSSSEEDQALQPELRLETGVADALPERKQDPSKWVTESEDGRPPVEPLARRRRSWLWNQFFVIEEYRGPEPVLIGRVSLCLICIQLSCVHVRRDVLNSGKTVLRVRRREKSVF